jgi:insulysin
MFVPNELEVNTSVSYYCHVGDVTDSRLRAKLALFEHITREMCFDQLRTKEQLGYIVSSSAWHSVGSMGWRILVQSERHADYIGTRIDIFLATLKERLSSMTDEEFNAHRIGLIALKMEKFKNLGEEMGSFWGHIQSGYQDFTRSASYINTLVIHV